MDGSSQGSIDKKLKPAVTKELNRIGLEEEIKDAIEKPLLLVAAPSGYGKTVLIKNYFENHKKLRKIYFPFGQNETDETWIWVQLSEKVKMYNEELGNLIKEMELPKTKQQVGSLIRCIKNYIKEPVYLILDDYQECSSRVIDQLITFLIYEKIPFLHIVIISRMPPNIPHEEFLLKGLCGMINQQLLTLDQTEVEGIFRENGVVLSKTEILEVCRYTDGWIAAVYLILFDYKKVGYLRLSYGVLHLLKTCVFDKLTTDLKKIFVGMSLFESFTIEMASYVMELEKNCVDMDLEYLCFVEYDRKTGICLMHDLLKRTAYIELEQLGLDKKKLYKRGAVWYEKKGDLVYAIVNYRNAGEYEKVLELLSGAEGRLLFEKAPAIISEIFQETEKDILLDYPSAYLRYLYYIILKDNAEKGKQLYEDIKETYSARYSGGSLEGREEEFKKLTGEMYIIKALLNFNNLERMTMCMERAYELFNRSSSTIFLDNLLTYGSPQVLLLYHNKIGNLYETVQMEKKYTKLYMKLICRINGDADELLDGEYYLITGDIVKAYEKAKRAREKAKIRKQTCITISCYHVLMRCAILFGNRDELEQLASELQEEMTGTGRTQLVTDYELAIAYSFANVGDLERIPDWIMQFDLQNCSYIIRSIRNGCIVYGIILKQKKQWALLEAIAEQMLVPYETTRHIIVYVYAYIYKTIALYYMGEEKEAEKFLIKGIRMAEADQLVIPFVENAGELMPLLEKLQETEEFVRDFFPLAHRCNEKKQVFWEKDKERTGLTKRELRILDYVKQGLKNMEISREMNIALVTVEKSLTGIYRKLGVSNRAAAIASLEKIMKKEKRKNSTE